MEKNVIIKFIASNGEELSMGDIVTVSNGNEVKELEVSWDNLSKLIKYGCIKSMKVESNKPEVKEKVPMEVDYYIEKIAARLGWHFDKVINYFNTLADLNPVVPISLVLKEIALEMDKSYAGHIKNCKEIYIINTMNGKIVKGTNSKDYNYQCFAAFRTKEDAMLTKKILKEFYDDVYGEQED